MEELCAQAAKRFSSVLRLQDAYVRWQTDALKRIPVETFSAQDKKGVIEVELRGDFSWCRTRVFEEIALADLLPKLRAALAKAEGACIARWESSLAGGLDEVSRRKQRGSMREDISVDPVREQIAASDNKLGLNPDEFLDTRDVEGNHNQDSDGFEVVKPTVELPNKMVF